MKSLPEETISRLRDAYGVLTDKQLGEVLDASKQAISGWKKSGVPLSYALKCKDECGVSLDFLYYGSPEEHNISTNQLSEQTKILTDRQRIAVSGMIEALNKIVKEFELDNEKMYLVNEMSERLKQLESK